MENLPVGPPLGGVFWSWIVPAALFFVAFAATWLLYRRFSKD